MVCGFGSGWPNSDLRVEDLGSSFFLFRVCGLRRSLQAHEVIQFQHRARNAIFLPAAQEEESSAQG